MPSYMPAEYAAAYVFHIFLIDSANRPKFKSSPTLAAGDVKVRTDDGAEANITTLPTASGAVVKVSLSAAEMTGDIVDVIFRDAAGAEWDDFAVSIATAQPTYQAKVALVDDNTNSEDLWTASWFKNGALVTSGITSPQINVFDEAGTDLIAATAMTQIGAKGVYKYSATAGARVVNGTMYHCRVTATIDGSTRTWDQPVFRDS